MRVLAATWVQLDRLAQLADVMVDPAGEPTPQRWGSRAGVELCSLSQRRRYLSPLAFSTATTSDR